MLYIFLLIFLIPIFIFLYPALSLILGIFFSFALTPEKNFITVSLKTYPIQVAIVLIGLSLNFEVLNFINFNIILYISFAVIFTFFLGLLIGKIMGLNTNYVYLISAGTAICGASAMLALASTIKVQSKQLAISIGIIFFLNTLAIIIFPYIGYVFDFNTYEFGFFSALAIHDTANVIGTALIFDRESAEVATTLKLFRTLWIIPLLLFVTYKFKSTQENIFFTIPKFIIFFIFAVALNLLFSIPESINNIFEIGSIVLINLGLFCIGTQFSYKNLNPNSLYIALGFSLILWISIILLTLLPISINFFRFN